MNDTQYLIDNVLLDDKYDMTAVEMQYIKESNEKKLGHIDLADIMYDAYKLGFAKGLEKAGQKIKN